MSQKANTETPTLTAVLVDTKGNEYQMEFTPGQQLDVGKIEVAEIRLLYPEPRLEEE